MSERKFINKDGSVKVDVLAMQEAQAAANAQAHGIEPERVAELMAHKFMQGTDFKDYAILYRGNHQSRIFEKLLMSNRIPYKISGGMSFFGRAEIKDMMAYLRLLVNQDDDNAFLRIANVPNRGIGRATLEKVGNFANQNNLSLFAACCEDALLANLAGPSRTAVESFAKWLVTLSDNAARGDTSAVVGEMIKSMGYEEWLYEHSPSPKAAEMAMANISTLYGWLKDMLNGSQLEAPMTLVEAVNRFILRDMMERGEDEGETDQVQLMTLHASKGLEFPHVFMVGMEEGLLPHQSSIDEDNIEEERRLAYVGITRAQQTLVFSMSRERRQFGELIRTEASRFLHELPQDDLRWELTQTKQSVEQKQATAKVGVANLRELLKNKNAN